MSADPDARVRGGRVSLVQFRQTTRPPYLMPGIGALARASFGLVPPVSGGFWIEPPSISRPQKMVQLPSDPGRNAGPLDLLGCRRRSVGGMENPRLNLATRRPAGDRSLVSLFPRAAHSWSGNLVTNATWSDFWLNEGTTTYVERRIMEALYGAERAGILRVLAWAELQSEITRLGGPQSKDTVLHVDLAGRDPDDGATQIPYEKGAAFSSRSKPPSDARGSIRFLRWYFDRHAFQPITSAQFLADVRAELIKGDAALEQKLLLDDWVYKPGLPANVIVPRSEALERVTAQAAAFSGGTPAASLMTKGWSTQEWQHFLGSLPATLTPAQLRDLDAAFKFTSSGNSEVLFAWLRIAIAHRYEPAMPALERFLTTQGRRISCAALRRPDEAGWGGPRQRGSTPSRAPLPLGVDGTLTRLSGSRLVDLVGGWWVAVGGSWFADWTRR